MGIDTWYGLRVAYNEQTIVGLANAMVTGGLRSAGYRYLWIDAGWWKGARDARGNIVVSHAQWPHGMRWLVAYIHSRGLRAGIYTDAGHTGCSGANRGSYGHYQQDVNSFASWGFDAVKVDFCGGALMRLNARRAYGAFAAAIRKARPHRAMLFNVCNPAVPSTYPPGFLKRADSAYGSFAFGPKIANSWRTGPDVGVPHDVPYSHVVRNFELDAKHPEAAGPGHWNDPDYIVPGAGMSTGQVRSQLTLWAILAAPLVVSADVRALSPQTQATLTNSDAIAIDRDQRGVQARRVLRERHTEVWVKPLSGHAAAAALLNRGRKPVRIRVTRSLLGLPRARSYEALHVWSRRTTVWHRRGVVTAPPGTAILLRVAPRRRV